LVSSAHETHETHESNAWPMLFSPTYWLKISAASAPLSFVPLERVRKFRGVLFSRQRPDGEARRRRISSLDLRLRSNEARRPLARKPSGRRVFCPWPALARSLQPALGMLGPRRLGHSQNPSPQDPAQFSDTLLVFFVGQTLVSRFTPIPGTTASSRSNPGSVAGRNRGTEGPSRKSASAGSK